jgi:hypothetical protein
MAVLGLGVGIGGLEKLPISLLLSGFLRISQALSGWHL